MRRVIPLRTQALCRSRGATALAFLETDNWLRSPRMRKNRWYQESESHTTARARLAPGTGRNGSATSAALPRSLFASAMELCQCHTNRHHDHATELAFAERYRPPSRRRLRNGRGRSRSGPGGGRSERLAQTFHPATQPANVAIAASSRRTKRMTGCRGVPRPGHGRAYKCMRPAREGSARATRGQEGGLSDGRPAGV